MYASEEILGNTPLVQLIFCLQGLMLDWINTLWKQFELQVIPRINPAFTYMCYHQLTFCTEVIWVFCAENSKDFFCKLFACSAIMSSSERSPLTCNESWKWIHLANVHNYISQLVSTLRLVNLALKLKSSPTIWTQRYQYAYSPHCSLYIS